MNIRLLIASILVYLGAVFCVHSMSFIPHQRISEEGYNFWIVTPEDSVEEKKPAVIFLHGRSLCGNDLNRVKRYGTLDAVEKGRELDAYVIAPQNPGGAWNPSKIMEVVDWVVDNYEIDTDRIYVLGMSLGGIGTLDFAASYPDRIAAAIGLCGGASKKDLSGLNELPLWIVHGTADNAIPVSASDKVVEAMRESDPETARLSYDRIPGMNHSIFARVFYMPETYEWLFSHSLADDWRPLNPTFDVSERINEAYKGLDFSRSKKTAAITTTPNPTGARVSSLVPVTNNVSAASNSKKSISASTDKNKVAGNKKKKTTGDKKADKNSKSKKDQKVDKNKKSDKKSKSEKKSKSDNNKKADKKSKKDKKTDKKDNKDKKKK